MTLGLLGLVSLAAAVLYLENLRPAADPTNAVAASFLFKAHTATPDALLSVRNRMRHLRRSSPLQPAKTEWRAHGQPRFPPSVLQGAGHAVTKQPLIRLTSVVAHRSTSREAWWSTKRAIPCEARLL
jgi:hypothetical protein